MPEEEELTFRLPRALTRRVNAEARALGIRPISRVVQVLESGIAPANTISEATRVDSLARLADFLRQIPCVEWIVHSGPHEPVWWLKFRIDITSPIAWHAVQELGFVLNEISLTDKLPTLFFPVSPPPYINGGPREFLSWVIETKSPVVNPAVILGFLELRLPRPIGDLAPWLASDATGDREDSDDESEP